MDGKVVAISFLVSIIAIWFWVCIIAPVFKKIGIKNKIKKVEELGVMEPVSVKVERSKAKSLSSILIPFMAMILLLISLNYIAFFTRMISAYNVPAKDWEKYAKMKKRHTIAAVEVYDGYKSADDYVRNELYENFYGEDADSTMVNIIIVSVALVAIFLLGIGYSFRKGYIEAQDEKYQKEIKKRYNRPLIKWIIAFIVAVILDVIFTKVGIMTGNTLFFYQYVIFIAILCNVVYMFAGISNAILGHNKEELYCSHCGKEIKVLEERCPNCQVKIK